MRLREWKWILKKETFHIQVDPWELYLHFVCAEPKVLLESGRVGRYSYIAGVPRALIAVSESESVAELEERLQSVLSEPVDTALENGRFQGGWIGFLSYDWVRSFEKLPRQSQADLDIPSVWLMEPGVVAVVDHVEGKVELITWDEGASEVRRVYEATRKWLLEADHGAGSAESRFYRRLPGVEGGAPAEGKFSMDQADFEQAVEAIQEYIRAGDVFQVNLSLREQRAACGVTPALMYDRLREINPSPYMGILEMSDRALVSASPELLVRVQGCVIETRPIAGTRPRTGNREEDLMRAQELIDNEKERAEHIMLVDLERNDLGRVCSYGSVRVPELMTIEEYSHVMHIVSHVEGKLRSDVGALDVLRAVFPGGTITGAPKIRTMEIIEELEPVRRGVYTGAMGWLSYNGEMEWNILIRTMLFQEGQVYVQAGAGVVIDSLPEREYRESIRKATALWRAFEACFEVVSREESL